MSTVDVKSLSVACVIPSFNGRDDLSRLLVSLEYQTRPFDLFVVDSTSSDGTFELAKSKVPNVLQIPSSEFNHGGTRQLVVTNNPGYDIYVFMTQDAYLEDSGAIENLIAPFRDEDVGAVCGRQLPHQNANLLAQHARLFNYPDSNQVKSLSDVPKLGLKTAFMSNSFAAYRAQALREVGGFPNHVIFAEDMFVAARMLLAGWKVAYQGEAACRHSHNYSLQEEFRRYFDMGVFHSREPWIRADFGGAGGEGVRYVKSELRFLGAKRIYLWPVVLLRNAVKLLGYKLGQKNDLLPVRLKKILSMYRRYWDGPFA